MRWALLPSLSLAIAAGCSSGDDLRLPVAPALIFPQGLLDGVAKVTVEVLDSSANGNSCDAQSGQYRKAGSPLATKDLSNSGCAGGAKFCGDLQIDRSDTDRIFGASAFPASGGNPIATG